MTEREQVAGPYVPTTNIKDEPIMNKYRKKPSLRTETVGDGLAVLDVGTNRPYVLNATSALVFQNCDGETTTEQLTEVLRRKFNITSRQAADLVWLSLADLHEHDLLEAGFAPTQAPRKVLSRREAMSAFSMAGLSMALLPFIVPMNALAAPSTTTLAEWTTTTTTEAWTTTTTTTEEWTTTTTTEEWTTTTTTEEWTTTTTTEEWTTTTTTEEWTTTTTTEEWTTTTTTEAWTTTTTTTAAGFTFTGWFPPVENPLVVNRVQAGRSVPMRFSLGGNHGLGIIESGYPVSQPITGVDAMAVNEVAETTSGAGLHYDAGSDRYNYVWKTNKAWTGSSRIFRLRLTDGTERFALFRFI